MECGAGRQSELPDSRIGGRPGVVDPGAGSGTTARGRARLATGEPPGRALRGRLEVPFDGGSRRPGRPGERWSAERGGNRSCRTPESEAGRESLIPARDPGTTARGRARLATGEPPGRALRGRLEVPFDGGSRRPGRPGE